MSIGTRFLVVLGTGLLIGVVRAAIPQDPAPVEPPVSSRPLREVQRGVEAALDWLRRHQSPNGGWKARDFVERCVTMCTNKGAPGHRDKYATSEHDVGITGLAMLAFLRHLKECSGPVSQEPSQEYMAIVRAAAGYLVKEQALSKDPNENGRYGSNDNEQWIYNHAIATTAMAELLGISEARGEDYEKIKQSTTAAVRLCLHAQHAGAGWKYGVKARRQDGSPANDTSVTGWMVLALKAARNTGLEMPPSEYERAFQGALNWINLVTSEEGKTSYDERLYPAEFYGPDPRRPYYVSSKEVSSMTAVGVLCRLLVGQSHSEPMVRGGVDILMKETPRWGEQGGNRPSRINRYYWFFGSSAMQRFGGELWAQWSRAAASALLESQRRRKSDELGSWDTIGGWGIVGGRVYSTAMGALILSSVISQRPLSGFSYLRRNPQGYSEYRHDKTGIEFVYLPGGTFTMGSPPEEKARNKNSHITELQHRVTLSPFLMAKYEVSQRSWDRVMGKKSPSRFKGPNLPVDNVDWNVCSKFCQRAGLELPTEAQWEYGCRGGSETAFGLGQTITTEQANFNGNSPYGDGEKGEHRKKTVPVDSFQPNGFGLYNMHGNVEEWCQDFLTDFYPTPEARSIDPVCRSEARRIVLRGGSWKGKASDCRSAARSGNGKYSRSNTQGLRPVFNIKS